MLIVVMNNPTTDTPILSLYLHAEVCADDYEKNPCEFTRERYEEAKQVYLDKLAEIVKGESK
jgi:hypothetical protein